MARYSLLPLADLKTRVDSYAAECFPDLIPETYTELKFRVITATEILGYEENELPACTGLVTPDGHTLVFTPWSRSQLLTAMGAREKWFRHVTADDEASELTKRSIVFDERRIRSRTSPNPDLRVLRGLVSQKYADIPDTLVMESLVNAMPGAEVVETLSDKSDRALYAYALSNQTIQIPGIHGGARLGLAVVNSEVGYTSLWVRPMLWMPAMHSITVLRSDVLLRRIHRGTDKEIQDQFLKAMTKAAVLWDGLEAKLSALASHRYNTEAEAAEALYKMVVRAKGSKQLADHCRKAYGAAQHSLHNGATMFSTLIEVTNRDSNIDNRYDEASIAGAVLYYLLT